MTTVRLTVGQAVVRFLAAQRSERSFADTFSIPVSQHSIEEFRQALAKARAADQTTLVHIATDPLTAAPASQAWWDVPVAEVAELATTREARAAYDKAKERQRPYL